MKASKVDRLFLLGLLLFTEQMQLSIDRSKWVEFALYAKKGISVERVLILLMKHFSFYQGEVDKLVRPKISLFRDFFIKKNYLYDAEQKYIHDCIATLSNFLLANEEPSRESIVDLRLNLAYCGAILEKRVSGYDGRFSLVEHLNQNEILKTKSIDDLIGSEWLS